MKKINDWVIKTFGLRGSWSWAKKQMLNGIYESGEKYDSTRFDRRIDACQG